MILQVRLYFSEKWRYSNKKFEFIKTLEITLKFKCSETLDNLKLSNWTERSNYKF